MGPCTAASLRLCHPMVLAAATRVIAPPLAACANGLFGRGAPCLWLAVSSRLEPPGAPSIAVARAWPWVSSRRARLWPRSMGTAWLRPTAGAMQQGTPGARAGKAWGKTERRHGVGRALRAHTDTKSPSSRRSMFCLMMLLAVQCCPHVFRHAPTQTSRNCWHECAPAGCWLSAHACSMQKHGGSRGDVCRGTMWPHTDAPSSSYSGSLAPDAVRPAQQCPPTHLQAPEGPR